VRTSIPTKHNIAETGPLYVLRWKGEETPVRKNLFQSVN
jgi:hypothetical protein